MAKTKGIPKESEIKKLRKVLGTRKRFFKEYLNILQRILLQKLNKTVLRRKCTQSSKVVKMIWAKKTQIYQETM